MSKTDIKRTNFTPLLDSLVDEYGITTAAIFGRVWRYCQMSQGYCHAEQGRIADELNISLRTVNKGLQVLVRDGYFDDMTPNAKGRTRIYKDTGKAGIKRLPAAEVDPEPVQEPTQEPVQKVMQEPTQNLRTKTLKTDKKEKDTTTSSVEVSSFLEKASQEQREAYQLVRRFAGEEKALEKANSEHPLEAARDFLEWCAENGGNAAGRILDEMREKEARAETIDELEEMFVNVSRDVGYSGAVTHGMFDQWINSALGNMKLDYSLLYSYRDAVSKSMTSYFDWYADNGGESVSLEVNKSEGMYV